MKCNNEKCKFYKHTVPENCIRSSDQTKHCLHSEENIFFQLKPHLMKKYTGSQNVKN